MEIRYGISPVEAKTYDTEMIRNNFLVEGLFKLGELKFVYSHIDRIIVGSAVPVGLLKLEGGKELGSDFFLERRELGIINIGGKGYVQVEDEKLELNSREGLYVGMGTKTVIFESEDPSNPAKFYLNSAPAHKAYPTVKIGRKDTIKDDLGSFKASNERTINKYIHPDVCQSCQLVMGMTELKEGSVWNTMPCHTHDRRMEVYLYFDMKQDTLVFHIMGEPHETRHVVMRNEEAVISPSWSIHSGIGTSNYTFIWGMVGENQTFDDMDHVSNASLK